MLCPPQRSTFQSTFFPLLGAAVTSLLQHVFAFVFAALSACSQHPRVSYDHACIMSRNSNPVEHTSFPGNGREGCGRAGVQYSAAWSDLASLQRVMKQLRRSATYTPIFLPNERMSRAQVKNEPAQRGAALREKKKMGFLFPSQNSRLYCPPPSSKLWFQWGWLIKLKTAPPPPQNTNPLHCCI